MHHVTAPLRHEYARTAAYKKRHPLWPTRRHHCACHTACCVWSRLAFSPLLYSPSRQLQVNGIRASGDAWKIEFRGEIRFSCTCRHCVARCTFAAPCARTLSLRLAVLSWRQKHTLLSSASLARSKRGERLPQSARSRHKNVLRPSTAASVAALVRTCTFEASCTAVFRLLRSAVATVLRRDKCDELYVTLHVLRSC